LGRWKHIGKKLVVFKRERKSELLRKRRGEWQNLRESYRILKKTTRRGRKEPFRR